jgi:hypothetical protein
MKWRSCEVNTIPRGKSTSAITGSDYAPGRSVVRRVEEVARLRWGIRRWQVLSGLWMHPERAIIGAKDGPACPRGVPQGRRRRD